MLDSWASGLSLNPATPNDLRPLLLKASSYAMYGAMPAEVVDALLAGPNLPVRLLRGGGAETAARNPALPVEVMRRMAESVRRAARVTA
ncbi:hypothetical protein ACIRBZ_17745 [Streptomyces sp. NPDC094038]|uniref:hypothetical protein n=1 Tax=Streptomyces sp. NPDC094038 TaxID=3366055 RepID=UPI0037FAF331